MNDEIKIRKKPQKRLFKRIVHALLFCCVVLFILVAIWLTYIFVTAPSINRTQLKNLPEVSTKIYDTKDQKIYDTSNSSRKYIHYNQIPKTYVEALTSIEDKNFKKENGFSYKGLASAVYSTFKSKIMNTGVQVGGSGITQQLVKLTLYSTTDKDRTIKRKLQEIWISIQVDRLYTKQEQLEFYINKVYEGHSSYGAETISEFYFKKPLQSLSLSQQAIIAGLGQSPTTYDLYQNPAGVKNRRDLVLNAMYDQKYIDKDTLEQTKAEPVTKGLVKLSDHKQSTQLGKIDDVVANAMTEAETDGYKLNQENLRIYTSIDSNAQNKLYKEITDSRYFQGESNSLEAAGTLMNPKTGEIKAQVGGRDKNVAFGLNRAKQSSRSSGSTIKPLAAYGPAIEKFNWATNHQLNDSPYTYAGTNIKVKDYDQKFRGSVEMRKALVESLNGPVVRTFDQVGGLYSTNFMQSLGIHLNKVATTSQSLGVETSTEQLSGAYSAIANYGNYRTPHIIRRVVSDNSEKDYKVTPIRVMKDSTAYELTDMLKGVVQSGGTAKGAAIKGLPQAGKTGLVGYASENNVPDRAVMDSWQVGYTPNNCLVIWAGYDNPNNPGHYLLPQQTSSGISEEDIPQYLYADVMKYVSKGSKEDWHEPNSVYGTPGGTVGPIKKTTNTGKAPSKAFAANNGSAIDELLKTPKIGIGGTTDPDYSKDDVADYEKEN